MQPASTELSASTLSSSTVSTTSSPVTSTSALPLVTVPHALVTIGAGSKSKAIDQATSPFSYHVPLAAYPVGCAIFASGGFGFLSRLHGLSMDNVVEAEMVLPDGRIFYLREIDEERDDDSDEIQEMREMWWAFRGAGLTFGIITRVRVKAYHTGLVYSGNLI
jgi:FAD/FMN-containing dehydrogenase